MDERDAVLEFWFPETARGRLALVLEGLANGHYGTLRTPWEKTFFVTPLVHCEGPDHLERADRAVALARALLAEVPEHLKPLYEFSAQQPVGHRKVIAAFGRHPHRNRILGRESTPRTKEEPR
jgi:uncharacterized protein (DUF924 family)